MSDIKVSIIMPVYKVEKYVAKAIDSILAQSLQEWEFYIVDDGTPDRSGEICDEYAAKDPRIHVIHQENAGAPAARNKAMDLAQGEYLYFMDSDDWAEPTMLDEMYHLAKRDNAQLVISGFFIDTFYDSENFVRDEKKGKPSVYQRGKDFHKEAYDLFDNNQLYSPWNKLYERAYIEDHKLRFPQTFWDDFPFVLSVIRDIERVTVTDRMYYHFIRARAESETASYRPNMYEKREEEHGWMKEIYEHWDAWDDNSKEMVARRYIERLIGCVENLTNKKCTLSYGKKRALVKEMISKKRVSQCLHAMKPRSKVMKIMILPYKWKNVTFILLEGKVISHVKSGNTKMFATLKANR